RGSRGGMAQAILGAAEEVSGVGTSRQAESLARTVMRPTGPGGACHRAGQRPDPVGRPNDKLCPPYALPYDRNALQGLVTRAPAAYRPDAPPETRPATRWFGSRRRR